MTTGHQRQDPPFTFLMISHDSHLVPTYTTAVSPEDYGLVEHMEHAKYSDPNTPLVYDSDLSLFHTSVERRPSSPLPYHRSVGAQKTRLSKSASHPGNRREGRSRRTSPCFPPQQHQDKAVFSPSLISSPSASVISSDYSPPTPNSAASAGHPAGQRQLMMPLHWPPQSVRLGQQGPSLGYTYRPTNETFKTIDAPSITTLLSNLPQHTLLPTNHTKTMGASVWSSTLSHMSRTRKKKLQDASSWGYVLAQNHIEQDRLVAQHYLLRQAFNGDFLAPGVQGLLERGGIVVLDVGCGSGTWTMEMATNYPKATFIGIDQAKFFPNDIKPKNCHFGQYLIENGSLPFPDNSIDYIFQRDLNWGLTTSMWTGLLSEFMRVLKPGGWVELMEPDLETQGRLADEGDMNDKLLQGMVLRRQDPCIARRLATLLAVYGFCRVESAFRSLPLGWDMEPQPDADHIDNQQTGNAPQPCTQSTKPCSEFSRAMASQQLFLLRSLSPWLSLVMNVSEEKYNTLLKRLPAEWQQAHTYVNWYCATAQKPLAGPMHRFI